MREQDSGFLERELEVVVAACVWVKIDNSDPITN